MSNILRMPTYEELAEITNGELMKCLALALDQLNETAKEGKSTIEKMNIYGAYEAERLKRLKIVSKRLSPILLNSPKPPNSLKLSQLTRWPSKRSS